ncbi:hypothetical protein D9M72_493270 [compost metagenome]
MRSGFVQQQQRRAGLNPGQAARQGNPAQLPRAEFGGVLPGQMAGSGCLEAALCSGGSAAAGRGCGGTIPQVEPHLGQNAFLHHDRMLRHPRHFRWRKPRNASAHHGTAAGAHGSRQDAQDGALTRPAGAVEGGDPPCGRVKAERPDGGLHPSAVHHHKIADGYRRKVRAAVGRQFFGEQAVFGTDAGLRLQGLDFGCVHDRGDLGQGNPAVVTGVVGGAQFPQRQVAVRRQDQGKQPGLKRHVPVHQADANEDSHNGN